MVELDSLQARRLRNWRQTPQTRLPDAGAARPLIEQLGIVTLYPASPEIPNLYHAFVGDPHAQTDSEWDSPSGQVYSWRWVLGRQEAGFYTAIVCNRPTWVNWELLPAIIRLRGELRAIDELFDMGILSSDAYRVAQALESAGGALSTGELRQEAGFPAGKEQRAAYLKAVAELDIRLLVAKVFSEADEEMRHILVTTRYPAHVAAAEGMAHEEALRQFLLAYLPGAVYAVPAVLARHLKLTEPELRDGLDGLAEATAVTLPGHKGACYVWRG